MTAHRALINMREGREIWEQGQNAVSREAVTYTQFSWGFHCTSVELGAYFKKWRHSITFQHVLTLVIANTFPFTIEELLIESTQIHEKGSTGHAYNEIK